MITVAPGGIQEVRAAGAGWGPLPPLCGTSRTLGGLCLDFKPSRLASWAVGWTKSRFRSQSRGRQSSPFQGSVLESSDHIRAMSECVSVRSGRQELDMKAFCRECLARCPQRYKACLKQLCEILCLGPVTARCLHGRAEGGESR